MSKAWSVVAKAAVVCAAILLLSLGLCGIVIASKRAESLASVAVVGMIVGGIGLLLTGVAAVVVAVVSAVRGGSPPPPPPPP